MLILVSHNFDFEFNQGSYHPGKSTKNLKNVFSEPFLCLQNVSELLYLMLIVMKLKTFCDFIYEMSRLPFQFPGKMSHKMS